MFDKDRFMKIWSLGKRVLNQTWILYLCLAVVLIMTVDVPSVYRTMRLRTLNRLRPESFQYLTQTFDANRPYDLKSLDPYVFYYGHVVKVMPERADAWGILGFTLFHSGRINAARKAYRQAVSLHPGFFWTRFNLAAILFTEKKYEDVIAILEPAITLPAELTLGYIRESQRIYLPLVLRNFTDPETFGKYFMNELRQGKSEAFQMLLLSYYYSKRFEDMVGAARQALASGLISQDQGAFYAGLAASRMGRFQEAVAFFKLAVEVAPEQPQAYAFMSEILEAAGQKKIAVSLEQRARERALNPVSRDYLQPGPIRLRMY